MGEDHCKCWAWKLIVIGAVLVLARLYTTWDMWVLVGVILIIKGILKLAKPTCCNEAKPAAKKKK
ncbi:MAG: hypothetical protein V1831_04355 [Candidatus Woesearchaeota archaeon]